MRKRYCTVQDEKEILDCLTLLCTVFLSSGRSTLTKAASPAAALISISNYIIHTLSARSPNSVQSEKSVDVETKSLLILTTVLAWQCSLIRSGWASANLTLFLPFKATNEAWHALGL